MLDSKQLEKIIADYDAQVQLAEQQLANDYNAIINYQDDEQEESYSYSFDD